MPHSKFTSASVALVAAAIFAPTIFAATPATDTDKTFVAKVSQGGAYEVAASKLALEAGRASAWDVRDLAWTEVHDHTGVGLELKKVSTQAGITIDPVMNAEFRARLEKLRATPKDKFDAAYIADMESIHDKDEKLFAAEAQQGSPAFREFAGGVDKIVKRHIGALHGLDH